MSMLLFLQITVVIVIRVWIKWFNGSGYGRFGRVKAIDPLLLCNLVILHILMYVFTSMNDQCGVNHSSKMHDVQ